jgi:N-acetylmuramic acid 6-phosphate etherase
LKASRERITERDNAAASSLDIQPVREILRRISREDHKVAPAVARVIAKIARATEIAVQALAGGGRLIYLGAGTSGRLGVLDAAECIPTFGTDRVQAVMAGAPRAMFRPTEISEDNPQQAVRDLRRIRLEKRDVLVGISAGGQTPYTLGGMRYARRIGARTIAVTSNPRAPMLKLADVGIVPVVGPEIIADSSRMKAGTAQKLVLNMLSTATMARLGKVLSGWMINVQLTNRKLRDRGKRILMKGAAVSAQRADSALARSGGNLPVALLMVLQSLSKPQAEEILKKSPNTAAILRAAGIKHSPQGLRS